MKNECTTRNEGDMMLVTVTGEVDLSWSQQVRKQILDALGKASVVGVELSQVSYIDSSGIAALVEGFQNARGKGQKFALIAASPSVRSHADGGAPSVDQLIGPPGTGYPDCAGQ